MINPIEPLEEPCLSLASDGVGPTQWPSSQLYLLMVSSWVDKTAVQKYANASQRMTSSGPSIPKSQEMPPKAHNSSAPSRRCKFLWLHLTDVYDKAVT